jgi:hypothetical protein
MRALIACRRSRFQLTYTEPIHIQSCLPSLVLVHRLIEVAKVKQSSRRGSCSPPSAVPAPPGLRCAPSAVTAPEAILFPTIINQSSRTRSYAPPSPIQTPTKVPIRSRGNSRSDRSSYSLPWAIKAPTMIPIHRHRPMTALTMVPIPRHRPLGLPQEFLFPAMGKHNTDKGSYSQPWQSQLRQGSYFRPSAANFMKALRGFFGLV